MKVSIITVAYNSAGTIAKTIDSVLRQTYSDIEYWIIDGYSNDDTVNIIKSYETLFKGRMHWISEPDDGIYDAMNKGIERCTGDVVGILNSDDWFTSDDVIERMVKEFPTWSDAIYGDVHQVQPDHPEKNIRYYSGRMFRPFLIRYGFAPPHPSLYIRRSVFEKYGAYDPQYKIAGDFDLIVRLFFKHKIHSKYIHIDFVTMTMGGASSRDRQAIHEGTKEVVAICKKMGIKLNKTKLFCRTYLIAFAQYI